MLLLGLLIETTKTRQQTKRYIYFYKIVFDCFRRQYNNYTFSNFKVYNCASNVPNQLLAGPSIINASSVTKNKTSLPRIKELDTITHYLHHEQYPSSPSPPQQYYSPSPAPVTQYRAAVSNGPQFNPSVVNKHDGRTTTITTTTAKRPLKRQVIYI